MEYSSKKKIERTILVISAHPDDEILGCGASIAKWTAAGDIVHIVIMAEGETSRDMVRNRDAKNEKLLLLEIELVNFTNLLVFNLVNSVEFKFVILSILSKSSFFIS